MASSDTDNAWEFFGKNNPYYGVLTQDRFRSDAINRDAKQEFFASGEAYIESVAEIVTETFGTFHPARALDFGCGVGRLALPLARRCDAVVGVDVSQSMLRVAEENAEERGHQNVTFVQSDDSLSRVTGEFDFVHSFIVFQHIPTDRGQRIFQRLVHLLQPDGIGALHVTYGFGGTLSASRRLVLSVKRSMPFISTLLANISRRRLFWEPAMQMNHYDLNILFRILQDSGCHQVHARFSETSVHNQPLYGVTLFFRKRELDVKAHG